MKAFNVTVVGCAALLAVLLLLAQTQAQAPRAAAPRYPRVGVCDVGEVFNGYNRREDLNTELERKRGAAQQEDDKRAAAMKKVQDTLKQLKAGSEQYEARMDELQRITIQRAAWREFEEKKFLSEHRRMMEVLYREILDAVAEAAKAQGYDLVVYRETVEIDSRTTTELYQKIAQRKCLYVNPAIDITQVVLDRLNSQYKAGRG